MPVPRSRIEGCCFEVGLDLDLDFAAPARVLHGASGNSAEVRNPRTLSGALCSVNHDVPGSSSSSTPSSPSESLALVWFVVEGFAASVSSAGAVGTGAAPGLDFEERCARVLS